MYIRIDGNTNLLLFFCSLQFRGTQKVSWICLLFLSWGRQGSWLWCKYIFLCLLVAPKLYDSWNGNILHVEILRNFHFVSTSKHYFSLGSDVMQVAKNFTSRLRFQELLLFKILKWQFNKSHLKSLGKLIFLGSIYLFSNRIRMEYGHTKKTIKKNPFIWPCHLILRSRFSEKRSS